MHFKAIIAVSLPVLSAFAAPQAESTVTASATDTSTAPQSSPTAAYGLISSLSGSPIHFLPWNAAGLRFYLGGTTASYCPESVNATGSCPQGDTTAFLGTCAMDVLVPGGQQIYLTPTGELGYTQAHSISIPEGSQVCPFYYSKKADASVADITLDPNRAFGAGGFMACPTDSGYYQVFASMQNATVPKGNIDDCLVFNALAGDYNDGGFAAWQYT